MPSHSLLSSNATFEGKLISIIILSFYTFFPFLHVRLKCNNSHNKIRIRRILNITPAKEQGITAGVPNYFENNNTSSAGYEIRYKRIPIYDSSTSDILSYADEMIDFISNGLHHGGVLVHCQKGVSRSATAVIMFLMRKANMTMNQAILLCKRRRHVVDPIPSFLTQLRTYEEQCRTGGYLTAMDDDIHDVNDDVANEDCKGDLKRKAENIGDGFDKKRKTAIGPTPSIGPSRGPAIGPARGPALSIGPVKGPPEGEFTTDKKI